MSGQLDISIRWRSVGGDRTCLNPPKAKDVVPRMSLDKRVLSLPEVVKAVLLMGTSRSNQGVAENRASLSSCVFSIP